MYIDLHQCNMLFKKTQVGSHQRQVAFFFVIVDGLGKATMALARTVAPHVRKQGEKILPESVTKKDGGRSRVDDVAEVAAGGLAGTSLTYIAG